MGWKAIETQTSVEQKEYVTENILVHESDYNKIIQLPLSNPIVTFSMQRIYSESKSFINPHQQTILISGMEN